MVSDKSSKKKKKWAKKKTLSAPRPGEMGFPKGPPPLCPRPRLAPAPCTRTECTHSNLHWERPRCPPTHGNDSQKPRSCTLSTTASRMFDQNFTRIYITQKYRGGKSLLNRTSAPSENATWFIFDINHLEKVRNSYFFRESGKPEPFTSTWTSAAAALICWWHPGTTLWPIHHLRCWFLCPFAYNLCVSSLRLCSLRWEPAPSQKPKQSD